MTRRLYFSLERTLFRTLLGCGLVALGSYLTFLSIQNPNFFMETEDRHYHGQGSAVLGLVFNFTHGYAAIPLFLFFTLFIAKHVVLSVWAFFTFKPAISLIADSVEFHRSIPKVPDNISFSKIFDVRLRRYGQTNQARKARRVNAILGVRGSSASAKSLCLSIGYRDEAGAEKEALLMMQLFQGGGWALGNFARLLRRSWSAYNMKLEQNRYFKGEIWSSTQQ